MGLGWDEDVDARMGFGGLSILRLLLLDWQHFVELCKRCEGAGVCVKCCIDRHRGELRESSLV
jgi:hypothetical protein